MVGIPFHQWVEKASNFWWLRQSDDLQFPISNKHLSPFFIVSSGRSGTTLLRKKLLNSDQIHIPPESDDFIPYNAIHFIKRNRDGWDKLTSDILKNFQQQPFFKYWGTELDGLSEKLKALPSEDRSYANLINLLYTHACLQHKSTLEFWGDKTPYLMYRLEWLRKIFPGARYIHLVRDGRAVVHSMVKKQNYSLEQAILRWKDSIRLFAGHCRFVSPESVLEIKYEDFVMNTRKTLMEVYQFIGLRFNEDMLRDRNFIIGDDVLSHHDDLHKPITTASIDKWRKEMNVQEIMLMNNKLQKELRQLDYPD